MRWRVQMAGFGSARCTLQKPAAGALSGVLEQVVQREPRHAGLGADGGTGRYGDRALRRCRGSGFSRGLRRVEDSRAPTRSCRSRHRAGKVVVEAFAIRLPSYSSRGRRFKTVALKPGPGEYGLCRVGVVCQCRLASLARPLDSHPRCNGRSALFWVLWSLLAVRFRSHLSARRVERQMEIASQVQRGLLPAADFLAARF